MMNQNNLLEEQNSTNGPSEPQLNMVVMPDGLVRFFRLFSQGFTVNVNAGRSINDVLGQDLGIQKKYIDERIQTIFLNGKAVDNLNAAKIQQGSSLALSASMPGLVGSTFRRGGALASMRSQISHHNDSTTHSDRQVRVIVKLFNLIAKELGPTILQQGVWLKGEQLQEFISQNLDYLKQVCISLTLDEQIIDISKLTNTDFTNKSVFLKITTT